jgi:hypothetical protein
MEIVPELGRGAQTPVYRVRRCGATTGRRRGRHRARPGATDPNTVSVDLAELEPDDNLDTVLGRANRARYGAKLDGRDRVRNRVMAG